MMTTLKQWYDSLSETAQKWVDVNCSTWFDKSQVDYYRKAPEYALDEKSFKEMLKVSMNERNSESSQMKMVSTRFAATLYYLNQKHPELISAETKDNRILEILENSYLRSQELFLYVTDKEKRIEAFDKIFRRYSNYTFENYLYLMRDYSNIILDTDMCSIPKMTEPVIEILGKEQVKKLLNDTDIGATTKMVDTGKENALFDEMFFCDEDMTQYRKKLILNELYCHNYHMPELQDIQDFFKRIVAVDHSYLRFIYKIIDKYPSLAMKLYNEKKPDDEIEGNSVSGQFRYSPEIRRMFIIAHMCTLKRVTKTKASIAKEVAPLLKIYGYNFDTIYDALYPDDEAIY